MLREFECQYCGAKTSVERSANFSVLCPHCKRTIGGECEYGYGPVTPCRMYYGKEIVGMLDHTDCPYNDQYYVEIKGKKIPLKNAYLKAIYEAEDVVRKHLGVIHPKKNIHIKTEGGSLCFYGNQFGDAHDLYHKIKEIYYDDEVLEIIFEYTGRLIIYKPQNIVNTDIAFRIEKAEKIKLLYLPPKTYEYFPITYTRKDDRILKTTPIKTEYLDLKDPDTAVYLGCFKNPMVS